MATEFIVFPQINPVIFEIGPLGLRWYGLMYLFGLIFAHWLGKRRITQTKITGWTIDQFDNLLFAGFIGLFLGGRIVYVLVYQWLKFINDPLSLFYVWEGGMSFHGGLLGAIAAMIFISYQQHRSFWQTADFVAPLVPFGLGVGRIGNFINDELWGRETDVPWAVLFPNGGFVPRHPSQIYEFLLEGVLLLIILNLYIRKPRPTGATAGLFMCLYGVFRFFVEFFREPDAHLGLLGHLHMSMGQILSLPMIIFGLIIIYLAQKNKL